MPRRTRKEIFLSLIPLMILALWGCAGRTAPKPAEAPMLKPISSFSYPKFEDDMAMDGLSHAIEQSLCYYRKLDPEQRIAFGENTFPVGEVLNAMAEFSAFVAARPSPECLREFIHQRFRLYQIGGADGESVKFTGYYEPVIKGALASSDAYPHPIYGKPRDLVTVDLSGFSEEFQGKRITGRWTGETFVPYHDRIAIETTGALEGYADILAWTDDPVDLFFLQIQGSGKLILEDGGILRLQYAASNGKPYRSIGKWLVEQGRIEKERMSMQAIREYLAAHPQEREDILRVNPSYVFFEAGENGPKGAIGVALTPGRSIATDSRLFPKGALAFIMTRKPLIDAKGEICEWRDFSRFVVNQDTGGAIRGPSRADIFWGSDDYAKIAAGHLQHMGALYFLAPVR